MTTEITSFNALTGQNYTSDSGCKIEQEKTDRDIFTTVYDKKGNVIYEEIDSPISDSSLEYFYNEEGKLNSTTHQWYECGNDYGRHEGHGVMKHQTVTIYNEEGKPETKTSQSILGDVSRSTITRYKYDENGDSVSWQDVNNNGKLDKDEIPARTIYEKNGDSTTWKDINNNGIADQEDWFPEHCDKDGNYLSKEEFKEKNPSSKFYNEFYEDPNIKSETNTKEQSFFDKITDFFKNLFK